MCFIAKWIVCHHNNPEVLGSNPGVNISFPLECLGMPGNNYFVTKMKFPSGVCVKPSHKWASDPTLVTTDTAATPVHRPTTIFVGVRHTTHHRTFITLFNVIRHTTHWADAG